jgi:ZIP family zinc transporter
MEGSAELALLLTVLAFISLDQLIPNAKKYDEGHTSVYGLVGGMVVMALTLLILPS